MKEKNDVVFALQRSVSDDSTLFDTDFSAGSQDAPSLFFICLLWIQRRVKAALTYIRRGSNQELQSFTALHRGALCLGVPQDTTVHL